ncbi:MAG: hypothetical protein KatS3mg076_0723 [Candidatus Binatia bacterium]|nr:MAG: hypothetical protein KatS3mg076_0723 [Candidatus Binatia bacterium]
MKDDFHELPFARCERCAAEVLTHVRFEAGAEIRLCIRCDHPVSVGYAVPAREVEQRGFGARSGGARAGCACACRGAGHA